MKHYKEMGRQAGMTLIELTVVLLILIGLAGLLVPYVGSFTQTTHDSTNSNNLTQLNNAFGKYVAEKNRLPPHVDTLTNGTAGTAASGATGACVGAAQWDVYCGLANSALFSKVTFAANSIQAKSLANSGINMAVANNPNVENKTFGTSTDMIYLNDATLATNPMMGGLTAYNGTTSFAILNGSGSTAAMMKVEDTLSKALGRDAMVYDAGCYDYIAVGLGDNNELIQSTMAAAPVYFPQEAKYGPAAAYAHFIAILQVDKKNDGTGNMQKCSTITEKAKFLGVVANVPVTESAELVGINTALSQGWTNRAAN